MDSTPSNNNSKNAILGILVALLLATNGYWFCNKQKADTQITNVTMKLDEETKLFTESEKQFQTSLSELEVMRGSNAELNKVIDAQKAQLIQQKGKIDNLLRNKKDLAGAMAELENMKAMSANYKAEIDRLSKDKEALTVRVGEVEKQAATLQTNLTESTTKNQTLTTEKEELTTVKQNLETQNDSYLTELKRVPVKVLSAEPKYRDKSGKIKSNNSLRDANVVEVVLELGDNERTEAANEQFFVQMLNPVGEPVNVGGKFVNAKDKSEVRYTKAFTYDYSKKKKQVTALIECDGMNNKNNGTYDFKIYNKGYYAGEGSFKLDF